MVGFARLGRPALVAVAAGALVLTAGCSASSGHADNPGRLHDLRHFAATLHLAAGVDIKIVQDMLGHSSRAITSDTYTTVLPEVARAAAEAAAALMPAH